MAELSEQVEEELQSATGPPTEGDGTRREHLRKLVLAIAGGAEDLLPDLWNQVSDFVAMKARQFYAAYCDLRTPHFEVDDLIDSGYFAMLKAVEYCAKSDSDYSFLTFLGICLKTTFAEVAGRRGKKNPIDFSESLDRPIDMGEGEQGSTLVELLEDKKAKQRFSAVVENVFIQQLRLALDEALSTLTERQQGVIRLHYYSGLSFEQIAALDISSKQSVAQSEADGLEHIRQGRCARELKAFMCPDKYDLAWDNQRPKKITFRVHPLSASQKFFIRGGEQPWATKNLLVY